MVSARCVAAAGAPSRGRKPLYSGASRGGSDPVRPSREIFSNQAPDYQRAWNEFPNTRFSNPQVKSNSKYLDFMCLDRPGFPARVVAVTGDGTAFSARVAFDKLPPKAVLTVEVRGWAVTWTEPGGDVAVGALVDWIRSGSARKELGSHSKGYLVGFVDGRVLMVSYDTPLEAIEPFIRIDTARIANLGTLEAYATAPLR